jgi:hypothetical protein
MMISTPASKELLISLEETNYAKIHRTIWRNTLIDTRLFKQRHYDPSDGKKSFHILIEFGIIPFLALNALINGRQANGQDLMLTTDRHPSKNTDG